MENLEFRPLKAEEVKVRVKTITDKYALLLLYKDSRCDMNILDEAVTPLGWQRKHYECKGNLYCSVGIKDPKTGVWVYKDDCGTEGYTEKEKSEASDSFKRACTNWGIGRELYTAPVMKVKPEDIGAYYIESKNKWDTNAIFTVWDYEVTENIITKLSVHIEYWAKDAAGKLKLITNIKEFKCRPTTVKDEVDISNGFYGSPGEISNDSKN